jgi:hypothetical protein
MRAAFAILVAIGCGAAEPAAVPERSLACAGGEPPQGSAAARLGWMIGEWVSEEDETQTIERWCAAADGALVGDSRTSEAGREVHTEVLRIEARGDSLVYIASPVRQAITEFAGAASCGSDTLGNCSESCEAAFSNPAHDFPTDITYGRCMQTELLVATIRGGERRASWTFRRRP